MRDILKGRPFTQNIVAGAVVQIAWSAASAILSYMTVHFALRSVPLWLAFTAGAVVFFLLSISYYVVMAARNHGSRTEHITESTLAQLQEKYDDLESGTAHVRMVAHIQAHSIGSYVRITELRYSQHDLLRSDPYVEFSFLLVNNSTYDIEPSPTLSGSISFSKRELTGTLSWIRRNRVRHNDLAEITFRQNLTKEDVVHILNGGVADFFRFARLKLMLEGF